MKKLFSSRWAPVLFGVAIFVGTLVGLGIYAKKFITENDDLKKHVAAIQSQREAESKSKAKADAVAKQKEDTNIQTASATPAKKQNEAEQADVAEEIEGAFTILNNMTDPGMLRFDNPSIPPLLSSLRRQRDFQRQRRAELLELEAHINEQLQELHWHTNRITQSQAQLDKLFEARFTFLRAQEVARLQNLARIYETMDKDDADYGTKITQILAANQQVDPTLNAKIFLYLTPATQARVLEELVTGTAANAPLYQEIVSSLLKTMPGTGVTPPSPVTPPEPAP